MRPILAPHSAALRGGHAPRALAGCHRMLGGRHRTFAMRYDSCHVSVGEASDFSTSPGLTRNLGWPNGSRIARTSRVRRLLAAATACLWSVFAC